MKGPSILSAVLSTITGIFLVVFLFTIGQQKFGATPLATAAYPPAGITGVTDPSLTTSVICNPKWSTKSIRPPSSYTDKLKRQQLVQFQYTDVTPADYEEDHLISLELGGSPTDPKNLWPEPYNIPYGAHQKDKVENYLHKQVCAGKIPLSEAQHEIATDWIAVYKRI